MSAVHLPGRERGTERVVSDRDDVALVVLREASLRQGVGTLRRDLASALDTGVSTLVIDVSGVQDLSSVVVGLLLRVKRCCRARGGRVVLRGLNRADLHVVHRTGLSCLFEIEAHESTATAELTDQVQRALAEQRTAEERGDLDAADVAAGRVRDLLELHERARGTVPG